MVDDIQAVVTFDFPRVLRGDFSPHAQAVLRAGSEAIRAMRAQAVRMVRERRAIKAGAARDAMTLSYPSGGEALPRWRMTVTGRPMRVADYPYTQRAAGVSVQIRASGSRLIRHAFVATMPSGHEGVFMRTRRYRWKPGKRGRLLRREVIKELYTTRITDVFADAGFVDELMAHTQGVFERAYTRNVLAAIAAGGL